MLGMPPNKGHGTTGLWQEFQQDKVVAHVCTQVSKSEEFPAIATEEDAIEYISNLFSANAKRDVDAGVKSLNRWSKGEGEAKTIEVTSLEDAIREGYRTPKSKRKRETAQQLGMSEH